MQFYPGIQALRGIAAICVLVQHSIVMSSIAAVSDYKSILKFDFGYIGVLMFFCISGFVIGTNRKMSTTEFITRRFLRIYPSYWMACAVAATIAPLSFDIWTALLLPTDKLTPFNLPYWTLIYEIFFYALAACVFAIRMSDKALTISVIGWLLLIHLASGYAITSDVAQPGWLIPISRYNQFFAVGLLCAINFDRLEKIEPACYMIIALIAFAASQIVLAVSLVSQALLYAVFLSSVMMASARLVKVPQIAMILGDASYGIYLTHFSVIVALLAALKTFGLSTALLTAMSFAASLIAGTLFGVAEVAFYKTLISAVLRRWKRNSGASTTAGSAPIA
ncbi:acyltransferase [Bradyrhizobium sp. G127]|uniref:acyltransferase family protein n=1 Tax=Bradyrhizobium sp. G127 TaxID=2904800 RepID=UPI001F40F0C6|nr:acyltransferase [Bradyrhizobium sp. G127]MCF2523041.1 acyltransferase [Bradyrhizobium sp. G127]